MKTLNLLPVFTRLSVFSAAIAVVAMFTFVSSASAGEKNFDALGGVTAEALTPAAMDEVRGTGGFIKVGFFHDHLALLVDNPTGGMWHITINLLGLKGDKATRLPSIHED